MTDIYWIMSESFLGMRFYDVPNFLLCLLFVIIGCRILEVPRSAGILLVGHCALPFILNGVLFSFSFMPDVFRYWHEFNAIRSGQLSFWEAIGAGNVEQAAVLFALMPFPLGVTPLSLGFFLIPFFMWPCSFGYIESRCLLQFRFGSICCIRVWRYIRE